MFAKFSFLLIAFSVGICALPYGEIEDLEKLIAERLEKLEQLQKNIENATAYYDEMVIERMESLNYLHQFVSTELDKISNEAVFNGLESKKPYLNFECVVTEADKAVNKIKTAFEIFPVFAEQLKMGSFAEIEPFLVIVDNLVEYVKELMETKRREISQTTDNNLKKKILAEVADILKYVDGIIEEVEKKAFKVKFSFFEKFVNLCFNTETTLKKVKREDFPKIINCM